MYKTRRTSRRGRGVTLAVILTILTTLLAAPSGASAAPVRADNQTNQEVGTYKNEILPNIPNSIERVETFADPSIIQAKDGFYYAYGTKDPRFDGDEFRVIPIIRSNDLINWTYVGDAFPNGNPPSAEPNAGIFAPDIRYFNDQYYMYYAITNVAGDTGGPDGPDGDDSAIGVATSPNPTGPFTDRGIVVEPQRNPCCPDGRGFFRGVIDAHVLPLPDGRRLIYYGTYNGGLDVRTLSPDGLSTSPATQRRIAIDNRYEAPYVIRRGNEYFAFVSATDCCNFESTGYVVFAGKSRSPFGPFTDREGDTFLEPRTGGEVVLAQNGNRFVGVGHNAVFTDDSGQDYIVYHGIDKRDPEVVSANGININRRALLIDRLDYINGFPVARAGAGPSDQRLQGPVVSGPIDDEFNRDRQSGVGEFTPFGNYWSVVNTTTTNYGYIRQRDAVGAQTLLISDATGPTDYRAEADVRLVTTGGTGMPRYGLVTSYRDRNMYVAAYLEPDADGVGGKLTTNIRQAGVDSLVSTPLPPNFIHTDFHNLVAIKRGGTIRFEVTESRLQDLIAAQTRTLPVAMAGAGKAGFATQFAYANFDNIVVAPLFTPVTQSVPNPQRGTLQERYSDEFDGNLDSENNWSYAGGRQPDPGQVSLQARPGYFRFRTDDRELTRENPPEADRTRILIEDAPAGDFTAEIKLDFNVPVEDVPVFFQQAGIFIYENDDKYVRLDHVAIFNTRQIEFGKEKPDPTPTTGDGPRERRFGGTVLDNPEQVTWLRIVARTNPTTGEQVYTPYSSVDGVNYDRGGAWTFGGPVSFRPDEPLVNRKIGISAFGGRDGQTFYNADFDYIRVYTP
jgi:beta-xylosidase